MTLVDQNGHSLSGSSEENLPDLGKEAKEAEKAKASKPQENMQDARLLRLGSAVTQLSVVCNNLMSLGMALNQASMMAETQRQIIDPPEIIELKSKMRELSTVQAILEQTINERAQAIDEAYWKELGLTPIEESEAEEEEPAEEAEESS